MSADFAASFFNYESVEVHERADELALLAGPPAVGLGEGPGSHRDAPLLARTR